MGETDYIFVICINNSGGSLLYHLIGMSDNVVGMDGEGASYIRFKHKDGEPVFPLNKDMLIAPRFFSTGEHYFLNPDNYQWGVIKDVWHDAWKDYNNLESLDDVICVEKSPPSVYYADMLDKHFDNAKFIFMSRSPYAVIEGMGRRHNYEPVFGIFHWLKTHYKMAEQMEEIDDDKYCYITYEEMCDEQEFVEEKINDLIPSLKGFTLDRESEEASIDGVKNRKPVNLNKKSLERLPFKLKEEIKKYFKKHEDLLKKLRQEL